MSGLQPHGPHVVSKVTYELLLRHVWMSELYESIQTTRNKIEHIR